MEIRMVSFHTCRRASYALVSGVNGVEVNVPKAVLKELCRFRSKFQNDQFGGLESSGQINEARRFILAGEQRMLSFPRQGREAASFPPGRRA